MSPTPLAGPEIAAKSGKVKRLVIFLHGLGADGHDLLGLAPMLSLPDDTHFLSPHAPFDCDMAPYGYQWFSLLDRNPARIVKEIQIAEPILNAFIDGQMDRFKLTPSDVALVGFSQGCMMSLYIVPRRAEALAGVVGISGALMGHERLASEIKSHPPVCLIHGTADDVVPFASMAQAETTLLKNQISVEAHARAGLGHGIDEEGIAITSTFLRRVFGL